MRIGGRPAFALAVGVAQHRGPDAPAAAPAAAADRTSTLDDQNELALTVYNSDLALVNVRRCSCRVAPSTSPDIAATVNPATVQSTLSEPSRVSVLEQITSTPARV
jgi:hypothetical protein